MAQLPRPANTEGNRDTMGYTPIPKGEYILATTKSQMKQNKKKTGYFLEITDRVQEGEYEGKTMITRLNLVNPNKIAEEIAGKELNSRCIACGLEDVEDSEELHGIPFPAFVDIEEGDGSNPPQNRIKRYGPPPETADNEDRAF